MTESGYYPEGAEFDSNAPWNEKTPKKVKVDVSISYSMSKNCTIPVANYIAEEWEDAERDIDGTICTIGGLDYDFSQTNFKEEFDNSGELGIPELLNILRDEASKYIIDADSKHNTRLRNKWIKIKEACENWTVDEMEVVED